MRNSVLVKPSSGGQHSFASALGIAREREIQIDELMDKCHKDTSTYPDAIAAVSKKLSTANELAYVAFHLGAFAESQRSRQEILEKLLES